MDMNSEPATTQEPQYMRFIQRALKGLSELDRISRNIEARLETALEPEPPTCSGKTNPKEPNVCRCRLEELLLDLCNQIEEQRDKTQNLSNRIRL